MQLIGKSLHLSASDLVGHLNCRYLTMLDLQVAYGKASKPAVWDPLLELLVERGALHEQAYVDHLKDEGLSITKIEGVGVDAGSVAQTVAAMKAGVQVIVQGALQSANWAGRTDILRRVDTPSTLGPWSYEVTDTKLARETKGNTVLQLCLYSNLLASTQGLAPEFAYVVTPETGFAPEPYRLADYAAYYRHVRRSLEIAVISEPAADMYPEPIVHCDICRWRTQCDARRRADDHLSLVAGISNTQIDELGKQAVETMAKLAAMPLPLTWKPKRGARESYQKVREQARIQVQGRSEGQIVHEALPLTSGFGLARLPQPSEGDIFLDFEGDPFVAQGGLEFLFGYSFKDNGADAYTADWAMTRAQEKDAFERFIDFIMKRLEIYPDLHIYHFAPYEPAALKRLMGRFATRENELDRMLRAELFGDLFAVVRHAIRASVESYSIKKLEPLYGFKRSLALDESGKTLLKVQACLELGDVEGITDADKGIVESYNRDDCVSAEKLRDWLEALRSDLIAKGALIERPVPKSGDAGDDLSEWQAKIDALILKLTVDVSVDPLERTAEQHARWLLAYLLDWHRREKKATWWECFRLRDLSAEDLLDERAGLSGLTFLSQAGGTPKAPIHRYSFFPQDTDVRNEDELHSIGGNKFGTVVAISQDSRTVDIKKRKDTAGFHPDAIFAHKVIRTDVLADAMVRIGEYVAAHGIAGDGSYRAARDLLLRVAPRVGGQPLLGPQEGTLEAARRLAILLDKSVLPIQGPPGAGKTYTGARMICTLAQANKKVGVTANSHKVIRNILDEVVEAAKGLGIHAGCIQRVRESEPDMQGLQFTTKNPALFGALGGSCRVAGGTAWLWACPEAAETVDVLFIDEAAQMSLANVIAVSQAAKSIVLLGDPQQLEQPMQGSHPEGTDVSALDHILGEHATIPADRGLFLEETWRLHPDICAFTSELFYDDRLHSRPGLEAQVIKSDSSIKGTGLRYVSVDHQGNQSSSPEEADRVGELVNEILGSNTTWVDRDGIERSLSLDDILIIAPYNAQAFELQNRIPGARIGTVDKFQGQEAPIVIYSMTTSSHADAPRGMEFLYSANRLNVATSRAKCLCILVGSPTIFEAECRTPRHMQLANAFCRYLEMATAMP
jgi:predicted RecB family nuclease